MHEDRIYGEGKGTALVILCIYMLFKGIGNGIGSALARAMPAGLTRLSRNFSKRISKEAKRSKKNIRNAFNKGGGI